VYFAQFIKQGDYSEIRALAGLGDRVCVAQCGRGRFVRGAPEPEDLAAAAEGLRGVAQALASGRYDLVVLDEINVALALGLVAENALLDLLDARPPGVELVLTGRRAPAAVLERAHLVTEMRAVKHYFEQGVGARIGIEK
jgi:cob(I)alamin adenosyltransferase